jgi:hypothetical protein
VTVLKNGKGNYIVVIKIIELANRFQTDIMAIEDTGTAVLAMLSIFSLICVISLSSKTFLYF